MSGSEPRDRESMDIVQAFRSRPEQVLDRLVDGELGIEERRALLAALDDEPGGWRQCALAFVEAQAFGWQLARIANEPIVSQESSPRPVATAAARGGRYAWPLALAASVLVAFVVGRQAAVRQAPLPEVAGELMNRDVAQGEVASGDVAIGEDGRRLTSLTLSPAGGDSGADGGDAIELPLVAPDDAAASHAVGRSWAVSGALAQQFQRDGFEVDRQQQLWPVELPDGRSVLVPVEELNIQSPDIQRL